MAYSSAQRDATLHISSRDGVQLGNRFNIPLTANTLHGKDIVAIYPIHAMVPNLFNNARAPYNTFTIQDVTAPGAVTQITIAEQFYTGGELVTAVNAALVAAGFPDVTLAFNAVTSINSQFVFTNANATQTYELELGELGLGWLVGTPYSITLAPLGTSTQVSPNLAGVRVVHITSEKLGHSQGLHSSSGIPHDLCVSVPFDSTVYGGVAFWQGADPALDKRDYGFNVNLSNGVDIKLWDSNMQPLILPQNCIVELQFKIIHSLDAV